MNIPKEAAECWYHSCAAHYCIVESRTQPYTYPDCKVKDFEGRQYYINKKFKRQFVDDEEFEEI